MNRELEKVKGFASFGEHNEHILPLASVTARGDSAYYVKHCSLVPSDLMYLDVSLPSTS